MKNPIPSIQVRLKAIAEQENTAYQLVLIRPRLFKKPWFEAPPRTHSTWRLCLQPDFPDVIGYFF